MTVGERIKAIRKEKGLTQKQVATGCGMADSAIRKYESGLITPKFETLQRIADALNVQVLELLGVADMSVQFSVLSKDGSPLPDELLKLLSSENKNIFGSLTDEEKESVLAAGGAIQLSKPLSSREKSQTNLSPKSAIVEQIKSVYGETISDTFLMYVQLDACDQGEIRGEIKQMLKHDKYLKQEGNLA